MYVSALQSFVKNGIPKEKIIINDRVDIAHIKQTKGVQLAYHSLNVKDVRKYYPPLAIGKSIHSMKEAKQAEKDGADWVMYGHIFPTESKPNLEPKGLLALKQVVEATRLPVIAIGGIKANNIKDVGSTGAKGVAVLSGILLAKNPLLEAKRFREQIDFYSMKGNSHR